MKGTRQSSYSSRTDLQERQGSQESSSSTKQPLNSQRIEADGANPFDDVTHWIGKLDDSIRRHRNKRSKRR